MEIINKITDFFLLYEDFQFLFNIPKKNYIIDRNDYLGFSLLWFINAFEDFKQRSCVDQFDEYS